MPSRPVGCAEGPALACARRRYSAVEGAWPGSSQLGHGLTHARPPLRLVAAAHHGRPRWCRQTGVRVRTGEQLPAVWSGVAYPRRTARAPPTTKPFAFGFSPTFSFFPPQVIIIHILPRRPPPSFLPFFLPSFLLLPPAASLSKPARSAREPRPAGKCHTRGGPWARTS